MEVAIKVHFHVYLCLKLQFRIGLDIISGIQSNHKHENLMHETQACLKI